MGETKEKIINGYSKDFTPNLNYEEDGLLCEWEHCIENMPIITGEDYHNQDEGKELQSICSCPVFGHICPGGVEKVSECDKTMDDIPVYRLANSSPIDKETLEVIKHFEDMWIKKGFKTYQRKILFCYLSGENKLNKISKGTGTSKRIIKQLLEWDEFKKEAECCYAASQMKD